MKILGKAVIILICLLIGLLLLALLTALSWWMEWPLVTGSIILAGLVGLFLIIRGLRALWRWHDKRRFVEQVAKENELLNPDADIVGGARLTQIWREGLGILSSISGGRKLNKGYATPVIAVLDESGDPNTLFDESGQRVPDDLSAPLVWYFWARLVLLRLPAGRESIGDWESYMTLLSSPSTRISLNGIALVLSADKLLHDSRDSLLETGRKLRSRCQQLILTTGRKLPVHVLIRGIDVLPGMSSFLQAVNTQNTSRTLGMAFHGNTAEAGLRSCLEASRILEEILRDMSVHGQLPSGDMLKALESLRSLGTPLEMITSQLCREYIHQVTPSPDGIWFCPDSGENLPQTGFLAALISERLPDMPVPEAIRRELPFFVNSRVTLLAGWLITTLFVCGILGVSTIYQYDILTQEPEQEIAVTHSPLTDSLYASMKRCQKLERARSAWYLPTFGTNILEREEIRAKKAFVTDVMETIILPTMADIRQGLSSGDASTAQNVSEEFFWFLSVTSDRLSKENIWKLHATYPLNPFNEHRWTPVTGQLILAAMSWLPDTSISNDMVPRVLALLTTGMANSGKSPLFESYFNSINASMSGFAVKRSQFWPEGVAPDDNNSTVPPVYTAAGWGVVKALSDDLNTLLKGAPSLKPQIDQIFKIYFNNYCQQWENFIRCFSSVMDGQNSSISYSSQGTLRKIPHVTLFFRLPAELAPIAKAMGKETPKYISNLLTTSTIVQVAYNQELSAKAKAEEEGKKQQGGIDASHLKMIVETATTSPSLMEALRANVTDAEELRQALSAAALLQQSFAGLDKTCLIAGNYEQALALAAKHFGVDKEAATSDSPYTQAQVAMRKVFESLHIGRETNLVALLLNGMLEYSAHVVTNTSAAALQRLWETEVMSTTAAVYKESDAGEALYANKGVLQTFLTTHAKPFLARNGKSYAATRWGNIVYPFTGDFLSAISGAEAFAAATPKDQWEVALRSKPTLVNAEAKTLPDSTVLTLQCDKGEEVFTNRNYPKEGKLTYTPKSCAETILEVRFPAFKIRRSYENFVDFVRDFRYGERVFEATDFDASQDLQAAGIRELTVRILPDNVAEILAQSSDRLPELPEKITFVW